jgi:amino acid permease
MNFLYQILGSGTHKVKSLVTILSVWNTMIGSSTVSIPYATKNAGIVPTICNKAN